ncbi:hypothetical protein BCR36DRAFT_281182 [Piromyces finnis]|uniref:Uncharacterized protein n=1 Tax=Piromyces finnis TaxID=1754191 RepID=A0A1Y1VHN4_9FUNG|nr:hypothetical protein BCR36DRAFT_281182 [Piromyces finnis]|eukprot:ORX55894.1 hypothetical protein BCR36DRAFT_281182 [Piromyces finnis]
MLLYFTSLNFNSFSNYQDCSIKVIFKHSGVILMYLILNIYISTGDVLGIDYEQIKKDNIHLSESQFSEKHQKYSDLSKSLASKFEKYEMTLEEKILYRIERELKIFNDISRKIFNSNSGISSYSNDSFSSSTSNLATELYNTYTDILNKKTVTLYTLNIEFILIYIVILSFILITLIMKNNSKYGGDNFIQDKNGKWVYECPLYKLNFVMNIIEFFYVIYTLVKVKKVRNYVFIFKSLKNIGYSIIILVTLGPLSNVNIIFIYFVNLFFFFFLFY